MVLNIKDLDDSINSVRLVFTSRWVAEVVAGRIDMFSAVEKLPDRFKYSYVYYDVEKNLFSVVYWSDDAVEGEIPVKLFPLEFKKVY